MNRIWFQLNCVFFRKTVCISKRIVASRNPFGVSHWYFRIVCMQFAIIRLKRECAVKIPSVCIWCISFETLKKCKH